MNEQDNALLLKWEEIANNACKLGSGDILQFQSHGKQFTTRNLCYEVNEKLKKCIENKSAQILLIPLLKDALHKLIPLYPVQMSSILDNSISPEVQLIKELQEMLEQDELQGEWENAVEVILSRLTEMGFKVKTDLLDDLADISEMLLDALSFLPRAKKHRLSIGSDSTKQPVISWNMPKFATQAEFFDAIKLCGYDSCIYLGCIMPTCEQTADPLKKWVTGFNDSLVANMRSRNEDTTQVHKYSCSISVGIKRGENIWLIESNADVSNMVRNDSYYVYGRRATYLPYQVIFSGNDEPAPSCTDLAITKPYWDLRQISDEQQALWFAILLWQIQKEYFSAPLPEEPIEVLGDTLKLPIQSKDSILPAIMQDTIPMPDVIHAIYDSPYDNAFLIEKFNVTESDLEGAQIMPPNYLGDFEQLQSMIQHRGRLAVARVAEQRMRHDWDENHKTLYAYFCNKCQHNQDYIIQQALTDGSPIHAFTHITIDKRPVLDAGGNPIMDCNGTVPRLEKTSVDDGRRHSNDKSVLFVEPFDLLGKRPGVALLINPKTGTDIAALMRVSVEELPWQLAHVGQWATPYYAYKNRSGLSMDCEYTEDPMDSINNPWNDELYIRVALSKSAYSKIIKKI